MRLRLSPLQMKPCAHLAHLIYPCSKLNVNTLRRHPRESPEAAHRNECVRLAV